ncbi:hypothetical protein ACROYT_G028685 [Oculina patagonica]
MSRMKKNNVLPLLLQAICRECRRKVKYISLEITSSNHEKKGAIATGSKDENRGLIEKIKERQLEHGIDKESDDRGSIDQCVVSVLVNYGGDGECIRSGDVVCGRGIDDDGSVGDAGGDPYKKVQRNPGKSSEIPRIHKNYSQDFPGIFFTFLRVNWHNKFSGIPGHSREQEWTNCWLGILENSLEFPGTEVGENES